jgi:hypothetical protein
MLHERWHTWCCIYRSAVAHYLEEVSSYYFERRLPNGKDTSLTAIQHFQHLLRIKSGFRFEALEPSFQRQLSIMEPSQRIGLLRRRIYYYTIGLASPVKPVLEPLLAL